MWPVAFQGLSRRAAKTAQPGNGESFLNLICNIVVFVSQDDNVSCSKGEIRFTRGERCHRKPITTPVCSG